jgi:regulatory protein
MPNPELSLTGRALRYLSHREHSRQELRKKLLPYAQDDQELDAVLDKLEKQKFLSDARYAQSIARRKSDRYGSALIAESLRQQGVDQHIIEDVKSDLKDSEIERLYELWQKKFGVHAQDATQRSKQIRYLASKGFAIGLINQVVSGRYIPPSQD